MNVYPVMGYACATCEADSQTAPASTGMNIQLIESHSSYSSFLQTIRTVLCCYLWNEDQKQVNVFNRRKHCMHACVRLCEGM